MKFIDDNKRVLINTLLYVIDKLGSTGEYHQVFKILYFAEQEHIKIYGKPLIEDTYVAMEYGPVPSRAYNILKDVRRGDFNEFFTSINSHTVKAAKAPDLDYLSESEIKCIDNSLNLFGRLSFGDRTQKSHDAAYNATKRNRDIDIIEIGRAGGANEDTLNYLRENLETKQHLFR